MNDYSYVKDHTVYTLHIIKQHGIITILYMIVEPTEVAYLMHLFRFSNTRVDSLLTSLGTGMIKNFDFVKNKVS